MCKKLSNTFCTSDFIKNLHLDRRLAETSAFSLFALFFVTLRHELLIPINVKSLELNFRSATKLSSLSFQITGIKFTKP